MLDEARAEAARLGHASVGTEHVLLALGLDHALAGGSLRLTLGKDNTQAEIDRGISAVTEAVSRVRELAQLVN